MVNVSSVGQVYVCNICGNVVEVKVVGGGEVAAAASRWTEGMSPGRRGPPRRPGGRRSARCRVSSTTSRRPTPNSTTRLWVWTTWSGAGTAPCERRRRSSRSRLPPPCATGMLSGSARRRAPPGDLARGDRGGAPGHVPARRMPVATNDGCAAAEEIYGARKE